MKLLTKEILKAFKKQGKTNHLLSKDIKVICKFFNPCGAGTWYAFEYDEENRWLTCVVDLNMGCREIGDVSLDELMELKLPLGLKIERDLWFPIGEYTVEQVLKKDY